MTVLLFRAAPLIAVTFPSRMAGFQSARISVVREFIAFKTLVSIVCTFPSYTFFTAEVTPTTLGTRLDVPVRFLTI